MPSFVALGCLEVCEHGWLGWWLDGWGVWLGGWVCGWVSGNRVILMPN